MKLGSTNSDMLHSTVRELRTIVIGTCGNVTLTYYLDDLDVEVIIILM
jgi:hypothetical protein